MRKVFFSNVPRMLLLAVLATVLAACGGRDEIKKGTTDVASVPTQYDLTVLADKDGQYDFDGATLTAEDLRGHIRYLEEAGKPVKTILLKRGEKEKIKSNHILGIASMARDLKVEAFVEDNEGHLKKIVINDLL